MFLKKRHAWYTDLAVTAVILLAASCISAALLPYTGAENNSALIFVAMVVVISWLTDGYLYGIMASLIGAFLVNTFFMVPYTQFNLSLTGYPVAMISMLIPALIVCALTARLKKHALEAELREQKTRELYEINSRLEKEKTAMELENAKAAIRGNILLAVSHDLRTPLTAISGSASTILAEGEAGCSRENLRLVQDIKNDAEWLTVMVENILLVTKLRDRGESLKRFPESLEEIIGSSIVKCRRRFPEARIEFQLPEEILLVSIDSLLIQQVLLNLIENAVRHAGSSGPIRIGAERDGEAAKVFVRDYGEGLPESILKQIRNDRPVIVERRGDSSRGMGIGLSVCQSILKAHHSMLQAELPEGGGTEFFFLLEMVGGEPETAAEEAEAAAEEAETAAEGAEAAAEEAETSAGEQEAPAGEIPESRREGEDKR